MGKNSKPVSYYDYYQLPFLHLMKQLQGDPVFDHPHSIRAGFWRILLPGRRSPREGWGLVDQYQRRVESELKAILKRASIAYWLHLYRRLPPDSIGADEQAATILNVRATLEAAFQKYAQFEPCQRLGISGEVPPEAILRGLIANDERMRPTPDYEIPPGQLVLTDFGHENLRELFEVEQLAYEVWKCQAVKRAMAKGASLQVTADSEEFHDERDDDLDLLLFSYDSRQRDFSASSRAVAWDGTAEKGDVGPILLPQYNVERVQLPDEIQAIWGIQPGPTSVPHFSWGKVDLGTMFRLHLPFAPAFEKAYKCKYAAVFNAIATLCTYCMSQWAKDASAFVRSLRCAYLGPELTETVSSFLFSHAALGAKVLGDKYQPTEAEIRDVVNFLRLHDVRRAEVDVGLHGPHAMLLPFGDDRVFIDYAYLAHWLFWFAADLVLPDERFKGPLLEEVVGGGKSILPKKKCKALDGSCENIDVALEVGATLLVVECKAKAKSRSIEAGDLTMTQNRIQHFDEALQQIDRKAKWLAHRPKGRNFDISGFRYLLPVVVSPFPEFLRSRSSRYWLKEGLPRVLTPSELRAALADGSIEQLGRWHPFSEKVRPLG